MASVSIILWEEEDSEGKFPVAIRIIKNRKPAYVFLESIKKEEWDEETKTVKKIHPYSQRLNNYIYKKYNLANQYILDFEGKEKLFSSQTIKMMIKPAAGPSFSEQADLYLKRMKVRDYNQYTANKPRIKLFKKFVRGNIPMHEISVSLLLQFKDYVRKERQVGEVTLVNYLSAIRSVYSSAILEGAASRDNSPFSGRDGIKLKYPETAKIGLSEEEIYNLENVELKGVAHHARNLWLISYYFAGARISDVLRLRWSDIQNGRLYYVMGKNQKVDSLKIPDKAMRILNQYLELKENSEDLVFPELKGVDLKDQFVTKRTIAFKTSALDKVLKEHVAKAAFISQKPTFHRARHSFAQLAGDRIPLPVLQKLYRHNSIITTMGYQSHFTNKDTDDALAKVLKL